MGRRGAREGGLTVCAKMSTFREDWGGVGWVGPSKEGVDPMYTWGN